MSTGQEESTQQNIAYVREKHLATMLEEAVKAVLDEKPADPRRFLAQHFSGELDTLPRLLLISSRVPDIETVKEATRPGILTYVWDWEEDISVLTKSFKELSVRYGPFKTVAVCNHGTDPDTDKAEETGRWQLTRGAGVDVATGAADDSADRALRAIAKASAVRVDILACNLAATPGGRAYIERVERETGTNFAASTDITGNVEQGGNWILETDGIDVCKLYFEKDKIAAWEGTMLCGGGTHGGRRVKLSGADRHGFDGRCPKCMGQNVKKHANGCWMNCTIM